MHYDCDILIAGGGLAGGCLALALQATGWRVAMVEAVSDEQRRSSPAGDRALALAYGTVQVLDRLGLWREVAQQATPIEQIHVSDRGHFGKTRLSARQEGVEALGYVITARVIEIHLAEALAASSVECLCPARIIGLKSSSEGVCISVKADDDSMHKTARLVVGADGGNSSVRRLLEIKQKTRDYGQTAIVTLVKPQHDPAHTAYERFTASGPLAFLPTNDGCCSVIWTQVSEEAETLMALPDSAFLAHLQDAFGYRLGRLSLCAPRRAFPLTLVQAEQMIAERAALIGNAVHQLHPVAGQGFNLGLRDVAQLVELLIQADAEGEDPGSNRLLNRYAEARRKDHQTVIGFTDQVVRIFSNHLLPLSAVRNAGLMALDHLPWLKHTLARHAMGMGGRVPRVGRMLRSIR